MKIRKVVSSSIDEEGAGVRVAGGVNAVVSGAVDEESGSQARVSARQRVRVVQRRGRGRGRGRRATGEETGEGEAV